MKNRLRILFLASEVAPFAKTGGLADVASALPKALYEKGHDVRVMMPKYGSISERRYVLRDVIRLKKIPVKMAGDTHNVSAKSAFIPDTKVQVYFLDYKSYFEGQDLYVDSKTGKDLPNNPERFALFCRAALETTKLLHWEPDVIHCNDWQTALIPWILKNEYRSDDFFNDTSTLLSLHNMAYQGVFSPDVLPRIGLPETLVEEGEAMHFHGQANFLKLGILTSDYLTTVSPTYAQEIQSDETLGAGLQDILKERRQHLSGILNGVDYRVWNPEVDESIHVAYDPATLEKKSENKKALLESVNLPYDESTPTIGMISRLAEQKGFDLLLEAMDDLMKMDVQLVILGTGDPAIHKKLESLASTYSQRIAISFTFDDQLAHQIEAGSDLFLMPSRYEPCGLNQMYSLKYGTLPVVHAVGGLADTVVDVDEHPNKGNGFVFASYDAAHLVKAVTRAVKHYEDPKGWQKIIKRAMKQDFSWESSADHYIKLYQQLISNSMPRT
jgi:starch synthase